MEANANLTHWHMKCLAKDSSWRPGVPLVAERRQVLADTLLQQHMRDTNDQVQARVYLARRLHADA